VRGLLYDCPLLCQHPPHHLSVLPCNVLTESSLISIFLKPSMMKGAYI
jgi:hypothetical protein